MRSPRSSFVLALVLLSCSAVPAFLAGCGDLGQLFPNQVPQDLFIADTSNNRVLRYSPPFSNGAAANLVIGQADFTTAASAGGANGLNGPNGAVLDPTGNLIVVDTGGCRVLRYPAPLSNGMAATAVLGQPDLTTVTCSPGPGQPPAANNNLLAPGSAAFDAGGNLWVADAGYNRVVRYAPPFTTGMAANLVLGQADFTGSSCALTNAGLCEPVSVAFDTAGNLWVADANDNRVLGFKPPFSNGMAAAVVLGQPDFTTNTGGTTASTMSEPNSVAADASGNIYVSDASNNRVLVFKPPFTNGMSASAALGQADLNSGSANQGGAAAAGTLNFPSGVIANTQGQLIVADTANNRTLIYNPPFVTAMNATTVLGQTDFTSTAANQGNASPSATSQDRPFGAGPSLIALAVLALLIGGWYLAQRRKPRVTA